MENFIFCVVEHSRVKDILWTTQVQICCSGDAVKNLVNQFRFNVYTYFI